MLRTLLHAVSQAALLRPALCLLLLAVATPSFAQLFITPTGAGTTRSRLYFAATTGSNSAHQSYSVGGAGLTANVTVAVSGDFRIRLETETDLDYRSSVTVTQSGGNALATVRVRYTPSVTGLRSGTITVSSTGFTALTSVVVGTTAGIGTIRAEQVARLTAGGNQTVSGRINALGAFGGSELSLQDGTGGIAVFISGENTPSLLPGAYFRSLGLQLGDSITVTGPMSEFQATTMPALIRGSGQLQISGTGGGTVTIVRHGANASAFPALFSSVFAYTADSTLSEATEGMVIGFSNIAVDALGVSAWRPETNYSANDGGMGTLTIRTDRDSDLFTAQNANQLLFRAPIATARGTVLGIGGEFRGTPQLRLRSFNDLPSGSLISYLSTSNLALGGANILDIGTWNLRWFGDATNGPRFGSESVGVPARQVDSVAKVIVASGLDLIGLQEMASTALFNDPGNASSLISRLNAHAPVGTTYGLAQAASPNPSQAIAFVYKAQEGGQPLITLASTGGPNPAHLLSTSGSGWAAFSGVRRVPVELRFTYNAGPGNTHDLRLVSLHAKAGSTTADRTERVADFAELKTFLDASRATEPMIIVGDYNDKTITSTAGAMLDSPMKPFVDDPADYLFLSKTADSLGAYSFAGGTAMVDHIMITNELYARVLGGTTRALAADFFVRNYTSTTSDHLPVATRLRFDTPSSTELSEAESADRALLLYPNPTTGRVSLSFTLDAPTEGAVKLLDATGAWRQQLVPSTRWTAGEQQLDADVTVPAGLYLVVLETSSGTRAVRKLVVTR